MAAAFPDSERADRADPDDDRHLDAEVEPVSVAWSIVLAVCVLVVHVASSRAATLVPGTAFDRQSTILWLRQTGRRRRSPP